MPRHDKDSDLTMKGNVRIYSILETTQNRRKLKIISLVLLVGPAAANSASIFYVAIS